MKAGSLISATYSDPNSSNDNGEALAPQLPGITLRQPPLSRGPLSVLYRGWDKAHRREVIVKVQRATDDPVTLSRFGREAAAMLRLRHPSIVSLYLYHPGDPAKNDPAALVMEYVPGPTLAVLVSEGGFLSPARTATIIEEIAAALDCVHGFGIVHRDVKPSNILVSKRGPAKLTDFGVARIDDDLPLTVMGDILGTIEYASPEQVHGNGAVDTRSDVYSLAAVSYFVLTGTPPFRAADNSTQAQLSVMHRQVFAEPPPLRMHRADLTPAMEAAVLRGLAKAPNDRYESAGQLAAALRAAVTAATEPSEKLAEASARRTGALAGALASAVLLLAGFALWKESEHTPPSSGRPVLTAQTHRAEPIPAPLVPKTPVPSAPAIKTASVPGPPASKPVVAVKPAAIRPTAPIKLVVPIKAAAKPLLAKRTPKPKAVKLAAQPFAALKSAVRKPRQTAAALKPAPKAALLPVRIAEHKPVPRLLPPRLLPSLPLALAPEGLDSPAIAEVVPVAAPSVPSAVPSTVSRVGWYTVSGWIAVAEQTPLQKAELVQASPVWIKVDGQPMASLALGQWAELTAGKHTVIFQPSAGLGVGPKTWDIDLAPAAHLNQQIPLPSAPLPSVPIHLRNP